MNKAACFDFDGVIINSTEVQRHAFKESYYAVTGKNAEEKLIQEFFHNSGDSLPNIFKKMNLPMDMVGLYRTISIEQSGRIKLHENMKELLAYLNEQGVYCGLCTGKDRERTIKILEDMGLACYFKSVVCSDDVSKPKPDPESLYALMKTMDASQDYVVMVGDANNDIKCAKSAGIPSIGVTWGDVRKEMLLKENPDYIADQVSELKSYLKEILNLE